MESFIRLIKIILPLVILSVCLFRYVLHYQSGIFREFQAAFLSVEWMLLACIAVWCGSFIFLSFSKNDLSLIGLLLIAISAFCIGYTTSLWTTDAIILLTGVTLGKSALLFYIRRDEVEDNAVLVTHHPATTVREHGESSLVTFLVGLVVLLAFSSWWHLDMGGAYHGSRWTGLWDSPTLFGMLLGAGGVLAIGLRASPMSNVQCPMSAESVEGNEQKRQHKENKRYNAINPLFPPFSSVIKKLHGLKSFFALGHL